MTNGQLRFIELKHTNLNFPIVKQENRTIEKLGYIFRIQPTGNIIEKIGYKNFGYIFFKSILNFGYWILQLGLQEFALSKAAATSGYAQL